MCLSHRDARAGLFTSSLTSVVLSEADSIIQHQLNQRNPKAVCCWHILTQAANANAKKKEEILAMQIFKSDKKYTLLPPPLTHRFAVVVRWNTKGSIHWSFSLSIVYFPAELNITYQCLLKLTPVHQGLQSVCRHTVMCQEIHKKNLISSKSPGSCFIHQIIHQVTGNRRTVFHHINLPTQAIWLSKILQLEPIVQSNTSSFSI